MIDLDEQPLFDEFLTDQAREILRRRTASLARTEEDVAADDTVGLLLFRLSEEWYAARIEHVREIYNDYVVTPIPRAPDYILGVITVRGEIVSVTDIATLMRVGSRSRELDDAEVIPSAIVVALGEVVSAIVVDEIGDIIDVPAGSLEPPLSSLDKSQAEYVQNSVFTDGRLIGIVDFARVLEPIGESS